MLNLSENDVSSLDASFGSLRSLRKLYLDNNDLAELPEAFGNLQQLRVWLLSFLSSLPTTSLRRQRVGLSLPLPPLQLRRTTDLFLLFCSMVRGWLLPFAAANFMLFAAAFT